MTKVKINLIFQVFYQILQIILPVVTAPYVSRVLGVDNVGTYSYIYSVASYFVLFSMLGINNYGNKLIASKKMNKTKVDEAFSNLFALHFIIAVSVLVLYIIYVCLFSENVKYGMIASLYLVGAIFDISWAFFGLEEFKITVTRATIIRLVTIICIFVFVKAPDDFWIYLLIMSCGTCISQSIIWIIVPKYFTFVVPSWRQMRDHIKPLLELFIPVIAISLYKIMDKVMIRHLASTAQLGLYENAEKLINIPMGIITAVGMVMLPRAASLLSENNEISVKKSISDTIKYVMIIAFALAFGIAAIADDFVPFFFGNEFIGTSVMLKGLSITIPFLALANVIRTQYLIPKGNNRIYIGSVFCGAVVNLVANFILIPRLLGNGAVIGTILAEAVVCLIQFVAVNRELSLVKDLRASFPYMVIGFVMYLVVKLVGKMMFAGIFKILIEMVCGVLIYGVLTLLVLYKRNGLSR